MLYVFKYRVYLYFAIKYDCDIFDIYNERMYDIILLGVIYV
jgi:hypothetical protein